MEVACGIVAKTWAQTKQSSQSFFDRFRHRETKINIADLQKMAVAEWLQSFNSVRGPMERLGII